MIKPVKTDNQQPLYRGNSWGCKRATGEEAFWFYTEENGCETSSHKNKQKKTKEMWREVEWKQAQGWMKALDEKDAKR